MERILIATDLSEMRTKVFQKGFELAEKLGAAIELVTIVNKNIDYFPADTGLVFSDQWEARKWIAENELQQVKEQHPGMDINITVCVGDPRKDIIEQAIEHDASMIVMGTRGRSDLSSTLLGSTAQYVVRHSPMPVLVVPFNHERH